MDRASEQGMRLFPSLRGYRPAWLRADVIAGLTVWAILVPEALAYATIAGVSPVVGLYAAPGALLLYAVFGTSRQLVVGPMSATAALSAAAVADLATPGSEAFVTLTVALALTVGVASVLAGLLRLGFVATFISEPVLKGFIVGLALTIVVGQLPGLLGVERVSGDFFEKLGGVLRQLGEADLATTSVGILSLAIVVGLKEWRPVLPGALIAVGIGIAAVKVLGLDGRGVEIVGPIPAGLPPFGLPDVAPADYLALVPSGLGILLVAFAEGLAAARAFGGHSADQGEIQPDRELLGIGAANLASGLSSGMVVNGSLSKTAVNAGAGARSQLAGLVTAALTIATLLFLTGLFEDLPEATLSGVVIAAVWELIDVRSLAHLYRISREPIVRVAGIVSRPDFVAACAALVGVLVFDTLPGLFIGIGVSMLLLLWRASRPHVARLGRVPGAPGQFTDVVRHPANELTPGVAILRPEGALFFANAEIVRREALAAAAQPGIHALVLDLETVPAVDVTAVRMLESLDEALRREGVRLLLARRIGGVHDVMRGELGAGKLLDVHASVQAALTALEGTNTTPDRTAGAGPDG